MCSVQLHLHVKDPQTDRYIHRVVGGHREKDGETPETAPELQDNYLAIHVCLWMLLLFAGFLTSLCVNLRCSVSTTGRTSVIPITVESSTQTILGTLNGASPLHIVCDAGQYINGGSCEDCRAGSYFPNPGNDGESCILCSPGVNAIC